MNNINLIYIITIIIIFVLYLCVSNTKNNYQSNTKNNYQSNKIIIPDVKWPYINLKDGTWYIYSKLNIETINGLWYRWDQLSQNLLF